MSDPKPKTNRFLLVLTLLICCAIGILIPYSHSVLLPESTSSEQYVNDDALAGEKSVSKEDSATLDETTDKLQTDDTKAEDSQETQPTATPEPTVPPTPTPLPFEPSPEASTGVWTTHNNGTWSFMVNGAAYTGWLTDTDGHRYYFGEDGLMKTGLVDIDNGRYYFDADGIMQTGNVTYKEKVYFFNEDGTLKGPATDIPEEPEITTTKVKITNEPATTETASDKDSAESAPAKTKDSEETTTTETKESDKSTTTKESEASTGQAIALTFSDGPSDLTASIVECLNANNSAATFFVVGSSVSGHEDVLSQITASGSELGNQSYSNLNLTIFDNESVTGEFKACEEIINNAKAATPVIARVPEGIVTDSIIASTPYPIILWSVDSNDLNASNAETLAEDLVNQVQNGDIVLLHDTNKTTVDALNIAIPKLVEKGFKLTTVSDLASANGITLEQGKTYTNLSKE
ncbi:MAG: polysaccharide deacetylase family protein [Eubacteriales bacterium]|nr:polysaccharide deacetylase family protein [Eubacteriales bacterium]